MEGRVPCRGNSIAVCVSMCASVCARMSCVHVYVRVCTCTCVPVSCVHVCACVCAFVWGHPCTHVCGYVCAHVYMCGVHMCTRVVCMCTCVHVCVCTCVYMCVLGDVHSRSSEGLRMGGCEEGGTAGASPTKLHCGLQNYTLATRSSPVGMGQGG